ncbi:TraX family protein [Anaerotalea alkaliphila]|uniref:TraX protein n=1 Tax=Anaerotalea alkaliphila TaxID=2662126 RepID=A0A7X5KLQ2_9FIRM|nr:TraX family protein [Anaerotalea alkaliphila]NDL66149.1 hypothetical protein [Anaerotalea alkaliphila]
MSGKVEDGMGWNRSQWKALAMGAMFLDHVGAVLLPQFIVLRLIGRITFPIIAFFIAEGACHTRNPWKYARRLGLFALVSEIPFDWYFFGTVFHPSYQNVFFTLLLGLLAILGWSRGKGPARQLWPLLAMGCAELFRTDYGGFGVLAIFLLHLFRGVPLRQAGAYLGTMLLMDLRSLVDYGNFGIQFFSTVGLVPLLSYKGVRERKETGAFGKYAFYVFYPGHLLLLALVDRMGRLHL